MMKKLAVLTAVLAVMVGIIFIVNLLQNRKPGPAFFFPAFSPASCAKILFIEREDTSLLVRRGNAWHAVLPRERTSGSRDFLDDYPADSAAVQKALEKIRGLKKENLASQNPQKQAEFEVDTAAALFMECWSSNDSSLGGVYIGKVGPAWDSYFVRAKGSDDVYAPGGSVRFGLYANIKRWRDMRIVPFDKSLVKALTIESRDSGTIELVKTSDTGVNGEWRIVSPVKAPAKNEMVETMINSLAQLKAVEFEGNKSLTDEKMGFKRPPLILRAKLRDGSIKTVIVGKDKVAMKWVRNPEKPGITFTLYEYTVKPFNPGLSALKK